MSISACMIVRDEEHLLARCLESFRDAFDELNIVDTGSKDATLAVAAKFGARVRTFTGCNGEDGKIRDFALARNVSLEMATHEWILWMDADDVLQPGDAERFRAAAARGGFAALQVTHQWEARGGPQLRLFRNHPRHRFVGRIHEDLVVFGHVEENRAIRILHLPDKRGKEPSIERNIRIGEMVAREEPNNPRNLFYLGNSLKSAERFEEAILRYTQYLSLANWRPELHRAALSIAECYFYLRRWPEAIQAALSAQVIDPRYEETHCLIADCYLELGQYEFARQWFRSALTCAKPPPGSLCYIEPSRYGEYPRGGIETCERLLAERQRQDPAFVTSSDPAASLLRSGVRPR